MIQTERSSDNRFAQVGAGAGAPRPRLRVAWPQSGSPGPAGATRVHRPVGAEIGCQVLRTGRDLRTIWSAQPNDEPVFLHSPGTRT